MTGPDPLAHGWWLLSRAAGVTSFALASGAVIAGLAISARASSQPGGARALRAVHEHAALGALVLLAVHAVALLGDRWMHPGLAGILVPGAVGYRPGAVAAGIVAGDLAAVLGLSFYARRRIGVARWRRLHRLAIVAWGLAVAHVVTAGSDAATLWMRMILAVTIAPIAVLFVARLVEARRRTRRTALRSRDVAAARPAAGGRR